MIEMTKEFIDSVTIREPLPEELIDTGEINYSNLNQNRTPNLIILSKTYVTWQYFDAEGNENYNLLIPTIEMYKYMLSKIGYNFDQTQNKKDCSVKLNTSYSDSDRLYTLLNRALDIIEKGVK